MKVVKVAVSTAMRDVSAAPCGVSATPCGMLAGQDTPGAWGTLGGGGGGLPKIA